MQEHMYTDASDRPYDTDLIGEVARDAIRALPYGYVQNGQQLFKVGTYIDMGRTYWLLSVLTPIALDTALDDVEGASIYDPGPDAWGRDRQTDDAGH